MERERRYFGQCQSGQGPQQGRRCRGISVSLQESKGCSAGSSSGTTASVPRATSHHHYIHSDILSKGPVPCDCPVHSPMRREVCSGLARLVAANPVLKDFSLLLVAWPCCIWMVLPPALPCAWLIYFNIMSSSLSFIFHFLTMFTLPSLAVLWAEQSLLLQTPCAGQADLQAWQKSFPICSALNSSSCVTRNLNGTENHRGPSSVAAMAQTFLQGWEKTFLSSVTTV